MIHIGLQRDVICFLLKGLFKTVKRSTLFLSKQLLESRYYTTKHFSIDPTKGEGENSGGGDLQVEDTPKPETNHNENKIKLKLFQLFQTCRCRATWLEG